MDSLDILHETINLIQEIPGIELAKVLLGIFNRKTAEWFTLYKAKYSLTVARILGDLYFLTLDLIL